LVRFVNSPTIFALSEGRRAAAFSRNFRKPAARQILNTFDMQPIETLQIGFILFL
jgi:hypothetical protein